MSWHLQNIESTKKGRQLFGNVRNLGFCDGYFKNHVKIGWQSNGANNFKNLRRPSRHLSTVKLCGCSTSWLSSLKNVYLKQFPPLFLKCRSYFYIEKSSSFSTDNRDFNPVFLASQVLNVISRSETVLTIVMLPHSHLLVAIQIWK